MSADMAVYDARQTAELLGFPQLVAALRDACLQYANGAILAPERQVVPFPQGGVMLSMPATAHDLAIHKLVNVVASNRDRALPTIHGLVSAFDGQTGRALFVLDGPTVTARRTAAISMLGLQTFLAEAPRSVALLGTGAQAAGHLDALAAIFPGLSVHVVGTSAAKTQGFAHDHRGLPLRIQAADSVPDTVDAVITLTTSAVPVYGKAAKKGVLIIGVGAYKPELAEIAPATLHASRLYVDDMAGAHHEAGDLIQAKVDWSEVKPLSAALADGIGFDKPIVFKTVGCAAWDLAAARCALEALRR
ncbi:MAG TPA: bifunctional Delta(1)-pyrroline-2-carboxylate/Delta(1)-piperideine-2-carboxylate reductase [Candidimonas sp.]|nr:bifunctional Delta(1)-pyrroline-2-carboxylate/Delta(1)-piperideine-2-carboxylate reductase [Candidimonas sp.]